MTMNKNSIATVMAVDAWKTNTTIFHLNAFLASGYATIINFSINLSRKCRKYVSIVDSTLKMVDETARSFENHLE